METEETSKELESILSQAPVLNQSITRLLIYIRGFIATHYEIVRDVLVDAEDKPLISTESHLFNPIPDANNVPIDRPPWVDELLRALLCTNEWKHALSTGENLNKSLHATLTTMKSKF